MATFEIWHGKPQPLKAVGKNQCELLQFLERYPGWHTMSHDRTTRKAIEGLVRRSCITFDPSTNQAKIIYS